MKQTEFSYQCSISKDKQRTFIAPGLLFLVENALLALDFFYDNI